VPIQRWDRHNPVRTPAGPRAAGQRVPTHSCGRLGAAAVCEGGGRRGGEVSAGACFVPLISSYRCVLTNVRQPLGPPPPGFDATYAPVRLSYTLPYSISIDSLVSAAPRTPARRAHLCVSFFLTSRSFFPVSFSSVAISSPTPPASAAASASRPRHNDSACWCLPACLPPIHDLAGYATSYVISISFYFLSLGLMPHARMHAFSCSCISTYRAPRATPSAVIFFLWATISLSDADEFYHLLWALVRSL
jgi:hypothetical protein